MKKVLIPTKLNSVARDLLEEHGTTVVQDTETDIMELAKQHSDTSAIIVRSNKIDATTIDAFPNLKLIVRAGAGFNTIDINYARKCNIDVMNTPGANSNAVAEEVVAMVLASYRHVIEGDKSTRAGKWEKKKLMGRELTGKTIGILGLGNIGQLLHKRLSGFEVKTLAFDPVIAKSKAEKLGAELVDLERLFSESDIISLHIPENDETRGMINYDLLSKMKDNATLVNCARAGIIDEDGVRKIKAEKKINFLNDVYPKDEAGEKTCTDIADIMLPHLGASTEEANFNAAKRAAEQLIAYKERNVTKYVVNKGIPDELDAVYQELAFDLATIARHHLGAGINVKRIKAIYHGELAQFGKWFTAPIVAGIAAEFDAFDEPDAPEDAEEYLQDKGIEFAEVDEPEEADYNSITLELWEGSETMNSVSIRGTIVEGNPMITCINQFDELYFQPSGNSLIVIHDDSPGALARITSCVAAAGINIEGMRLPVTRSHDKAIAVIKTNKRVPRDMLQEIKNELDTSLAYSMSIA